MQIGSLPPLETLSQPPTAKTQGASQDFGAMLKQAFGEVNRLRHEADRAIEGLASGRQTDIHGTMIAMEKAAVSFKLLMQVRNKVVSAYETVMRMQV